MPNLLETDLWQILEKNELLLPLLEKSSRFEIPNWYVGAGFLAQTVWNVKLGNPPLAHIQDIDWVYFDAEETEAQAQQRQDEITEAFSFQALPVDIKNQAHVHRWYEKKFGTPILPYATVEAAIQTWPTTATAIGITLREGEKIIYAPFGLADLLALRVRPNQTQITEEVYAKKIARWKTHWPSLHFMEWQTGTKELT
jgi:hypothetical protein